MNNGYGYASIRYKEGVIHATATQGTDVARHNHGTRDGPARDGPPRRHDAPLTRELAAGSLAWQVARLEPGETLLRSDDSEAIRRACLRTIAAVTGREPLRRYDLSLWFSVLHTGMGETFRMLQLKRQE